jgi:hypothetical protein
MEPTRQGRHFAFDHQAVYRIRVEGYLEQSWSGRLAGMAISAGTSDEGLPTTTLVGELSDQASLAGVLNTLYGLHRPVLLVERMAGADVAADETVP